MGESVVNVVLHRPTSTLRSPPPVPWAPPTPLRLLLVLLSTRHLTLDCSLLMPLTTCMSAARYFERKWQILTGSIFSCLFAPPVPNSVIGETEAEEVAWCVRKFASSLEDVESRRKWQKG